MSAEENTLATILSRLERIEAAILGDSDIPANPEKETRVAVLQARCEAYSQKLAKLQGERQAYKQQKEALEEERDRLLRVLGWSKDYRDLEANWKDQRDRYERALVLFAAHLSDDAQKSKLIEVVEDAFHQPLESIVKILDP